VSRRRILFFVASDYDALRAKGVEHQILERDENGFFERVVTVHPLAFHDRVVDLGPVHRIYEFAAGRAAWPASLGGLLMLPLRLVAMLPRLLRIARVEQIHGVRATDAYAMGLLGWAVARLSGVPFCVSIHADYEKRFSLTSAGRIQRWRRALVQWVPRFVLHRADLVLPIREHMVPSIRSAGARAEVVQVVPHGIDLTPFSGTLHADARQLFGLPQGAAIVSFAGRMAGDNYVRDVAEAVRRIADRRSDVVFVLVGEGAEAEAVARIVGPHLHHAVRLLPFQPWPHVVALRRASTVSLCLMGGYSLIEACAAGSPVVAYDVEWHRELVESGVTGYLVPEHDVAAVAAAVERLLDDEAGAREMGQRARARAFARHDIRVTSQLKQRCYARLFACDEAPAG
jgi:glycosyltransferase involved in cell wall biosynthesis